MVFILGSEATNSTRRDFLSYALSLMRAHNHEHSDTLPVLDVSALKHIAYVFDALIYYMRSGIDSVDSDSHGGVSPVSSWHDHDENENEEQDDDLRTPSIAMDTESVDEEISGSKTGRKHPFFQRSDSTTFLGCPPTDPFTAPLQEALPLADQPQLLQPNSRREELFGVARQPISASSGNSAWPSLETLPTRQGLSVRTVEQQRSGHSYQYPSLYSVPTSSGDTHIAAPVASSIVRMEQDVTQSSEVKHILVQPPGQSRISASDIPLPSSTPTSSAGERQPSTSVLDIPVAPSVGSAEPHTASMDTEPARVSAIVSPPKLADSRQLELAQQQASVIVHASSARSSPVKNLPARGTTPPLHRMDTQGGRAHCSDDVQDQPVNLVTSEIEAAENVSANVTVETSPVPLTVAPPPPPPLHTLPPPPASLEVEPPALRQLAVHSIPAAPPLTSR